MAKSKISWDKESKSRVFCDVGCCKLEAIVTVDLRGQIVVPKELRDKACINAGEKLAVVSWEQDGKVCCISLQKADDFEKTVKSTLGPLMKDILKQKKNTKKSSKS
jgi:AbrB family looped-hinge helix DNA binding protein